MFVTNHKLKKHKIVVIAEGNHRCDYEFIEHIWIPKDNQSICETCKKVVEKQEIE